MAFLVYGGTGWIGGQIIEMLKQGGHTVHAGKARLQDRQNIERELDEFKPKYVMNAAGVTGRPNVDWCEFNKQETIRSNVVGTVTLIDCCALRGIHVTNYATGCIYQFDDTHPIGSGKGFTEEDEPNFTGSFYSYTKVMAEKLQRHYDNVLVLRLRMPISDDLHPRSFVTKITKYQKVVNIPNSMSILRDLLPVSIQMALRNLRGIYNFTNPGVISHNEILDLYRQHVDPEFRYANFSVEEQAKVIVAPRSNNELDVSKLLREFPTIPHIKQSIVTVFTNMARIEGERVRQERKAKGGCS